MGKHEITWNGQTKSIAEWARVLGIGASTLRYRLTVMSIEDALNPEQTPDLSDCCYPDCFHCPYPDCMTDEIFPGELKQNAEWSGLPQLLLSDKRLRMWNAETMNEDEEYE